MIYQNTKLEHIQTQFSNAINQLKFGKLLRSSNITKNCVVPAYEIFQFIIVGLSGKESVPFSELQA